MPELEDSLAILKRMEQNQLKSLEMQAEQLSLFKAQVQRTEAKVQESIALQQTAVAWQRRGLKVIFALILPVLLYLVYSLFKHV